MKYLVLLLVLCSSARAGDDPSREASRHFTRGVELYNDGDFRGALVEFKKAYSVWPRATVLYDIGQTEYQLLDYAAALSTMSRYLAETGPNAAHRSDVESTVETLRGRVGRIALTADPDCDVIVDDQQRGTTPLSQPLVVSMGPRKVTLSCAGRGSVTRQVELAGGESVRVELRLPLRAAPRTLSVSASAPVRTRPSPKGLAVGWTLTGLGAAAVIALGSATLAEQDRLGQMKNMYPVTRPELDSQAQLTQGLAIASDVVGVVTLVAAGVSTYLTVKYTKERKLYF
jgi:hypothetical protein